MLATFGYGSLGERTSLTRGTAMSYDPLMRLYTEVSWNSPRHVYDGTQSIAEYAITSPPTATDIADPVVGDPHRDRWKAQWEDRKESRSNCDVESRVQANAMASEVGIVTFDTQSERGLLRKYFSGDATPYRLSSAEIAAAQSYVRNHPEAVSRKVLRTSGDLTMRHVYFGAYGIADPRLDGLLGTATGLFRGNSLVGVTDTFNFDLKFRGLDPYGIAALIGSALMRLDALGCSGDTKIPVEGGTTP